MKPTSHPPFIKDLQTSIDDVPKQKGEEREHEKKTVAIH